MRSIVELRRAVSCSLLFALVAGLIFLFLNLPANQIQVREENLGNVDQWGWSHFTEEKTQIEKAGWPMTFRSRHQSTTSETQPVLLHFSIWMLLVNIVVGVALVSGVGAFTFYRQKQISLSDDSQRIRRRFDIAIALLFFLVPVFAYAASYRIARYHQFVAQEFSSFGRCTLTAEMPEWLTARCPKVFHNAFFKVDGRSN